MMHHVLGAPLKGPFLDKSDNAYFAMGCFWGAERLFWRLKGIFSTSVGYTGGLTPDPDYETVCTGRTYHAEAVQVVFDTSAISYIDLLEIFWKSHDPTQGMRQGNDRGTQYRSAIFSNNDVQLKLALETREHFQSAINLQRKKELITTEIAPLAEYYFAEDYHQQYLSKNPKGYCGIKGNNIECNFSV
jgi:peptide-methionine (S)-S-oxide reductase